MADVARKVCLTIGKDVVSNVDGVEQILNIPRNRSAPDKADCIFQDIPKYLRFKRTTQDMDTFLLEFDILRRKAEARMSVRAGDPDEFFVCTLHAKCVSLENERQLAMASVRSSLSHAHAAAQMRRLFGNIGSARNQDALVAQDMDAVSGEENFEAWAAYREA